RRQARGAGQGPARRRLRRGYRGRAHRPRTRLLSWALFRRAVRHARRTDHRAARRGQARRPPDGGHTMSLRLFVPCDAVAVALDADRIVEALLHQAAARGVAVEIVRTGSRGLHWLEPMVEAAGPDGRIAYGPVTLTDAAGVLDAMVDGTAHPLCLGDPQEIPFLKRQTRLTFARCGIVDPKSV